jgi:hypothetical protein
MSFWGITFALIPHACLYAAERKTKFFNVPNGSSSVFVKQKFNDE